ncbi:hypothetical protein ScalyP_jg8681 [Parmales sp. scaly parma]|nr:hypothetical protein ScalyP_jg8681 [Parmales sp. scaly parma]
MKRSLVIWSLLLFPTISSSNLNSWGQTAAKHTRSFTQHLNQRYDLPAKFNKVNTFLDNHIPSSQNNNNEDSTDYDDITTSCYDTEFNDSSEYDDVPVVITSSGGPKKGLLEIECSISSGTVVRGLVDTGAEITVMSLEAVRRLGLEDKIQAFNGRAVGLGSSKIVGRIPNLPLSIGSNPPVPVTLTILQSSLTSGTDLLIGLDVLTEMQANICLVSNTMRVKDSAESSETGRRELNFVGKTAASLARSHTIEIPPINEGVESDLDILDNSSFVEDVLLSNSSEETIKLDALSDGDVGEANVDDNMDFSSDGGTVTEDEDDAEFDLSGV